MTVTARDDELVDLRLALAEGKADTQAVQAWIVVHAVTPEP